MGLSEEAQEFNDDQKKRRLYYETEGRHLSRVEDELKKLHNSLGFLIDMLQQWMEDEEKRRKEEYRRSTYGMYDPYKYRTQRGPDDHSRWQWSGATERNIRDPYRNPFKRTGPPHRDDEEEGEGEGPHLGGKW